MGLFDDAIGGAVPGGNVAKPLVIALGALLLGKMMTKDAPAAAPAPGADAQTGGFAGGLGGLLEHLKNAGHSQIADSWVGSGQNQPIAPGQLSSALGQTTISDLAKHAGMREDELLAQLSHVLPGVVDKLTPNGRVPSSAELAGSAYRG